jgi:hypothetical protein
MCELNHLMACASLAPCHGLLVQMLLNFESGEKLKLKKLVGTNYNF